MSYVIIQPTSTERVQSGICYMYQWLYVALREWRRDVILYEDAGMDDIDTAFAKPERTKDQIIVDLSSYPQIDTCQQIWREYGRSHNVKFHGFEPLIRAAGLPVYESIVPIMDGVVSYYKYTDMFLERTVSDYDEHLVSIDSHEFLPLFLSVGCDRKCPYCYVGYSNFPHGALTLEQACKAIDHYADRGLDIHFYDEDLYAYPHIDAVLDYLQHKTVNWICLATSVNLAKAIERNGQDKILGAGNVLNEIGVETGDPTVLDKKQNLQALLRSDLRFFWLTVTFMPGETIKSKNLTGRFLAEHGQGYDDLLPRIRTNGSAGGLGQFFQPYHGTPWHKGIAKRGRLYTDRPTRLWPSFIGNAFLTCKPERSSFPGVDGR